MPLAGRSPPSPPAPRIGAVRGHDVQRCGALDDLQVSRIMWLSHQAFKWVGRAQGRDVLIQMPNLPRALNIWLKPTSVASCEPRRTVTVVCGVSHCTNVAAPTKSKMRISNIPAVVSFLKLPDPSVEPSHRCPTASGTATPPEGGYFAARTASTVSRVNAANDALIALAP
jgi:hypothetical protein